MPESKNIQIVREILQNEIEGDAAAALQKMTDDYSMTWVYQSKSGELFPRTGENIKEELDDVYDIKNRKYDIKNITENNNVVMVELIESYPDPESGKIYRTPLVLVLEMRDGKIKKGRHYCDPRLSYLDLPEDQINKIYE